MKRNNYINISDVASYIGQNKWDYVNPFERLLRKCDPEYNNLIESLRTTQLNSLTDIINTKVNLEKQFTEKVISKVDYTKQLVKLEESSVKESVTLNTLDNSQLTQEQRLTKVIGKSIIEKIKSSSTTLEQKKELVKDTKDLDSNLPELQSFINKSHGTSSEESAIKMFEKKYKVKLDTSQKFNKLLILETETENWYICGKVDGLYVSQKDPESSYVVEVKNRTKCFFNSVRDYELTQVQLYMHMLNIPDCKLVERFRNKIKVTDIHIDPLYINKVIGSLLVFIEKFIEFISDTSTKSDYLLQNEDDKKVFVSNRFYKPIFHYQDLLLQSQFEN